MYSSLREKSNRLKSRIEFQMSSLISSYHVCPSVRHQHGFHTKLYKFQSNVSANLTQQRNIKLRRDPRLGEVVYLLTFHNITNSWLLSLAGFDFNHGVTVKTESYRKTVNTGHYFSWIRP